MIHSISILNESGEVIYLRDFTRKGTHFRVEPPVFNKIKAQRGTFDLDNRDILSYGIVMGLHTFVFMEEDLLIYSQKIVQLINEIALYVWLTSRRSGSERNIINQEEQYEVDLWFDQVILPSSAYSQLFNRERRSTEEVMTQVRTLFEKGETVFSSGDESTVISKQSGQEPIKRALYPRDSSEVSNLDRMNFVREQSTSEALDSALDALKSDVFSEIEEIREIIDYKLTSMDKRMKRVFLAIGETERKLRLLTESVEEPPPPQAREFQKIALTFIKLTDSGPEVMLSETLPFLNPEDNQDAFLRRLGAFHMTIVGQGDTYAEGLFGPLPVYGYPDYLSYVFSFLMADPTLEDERSAGITYSLMVLFFPKDFSIAISSYYSIQEIFNSAIRMLDDVMDINESFFAALREELITGLYRRLQTQTKETGKLTEEEHAKAIADLLVIGNFKRLGVISPSKDAESAIMTNLVELVLPDIVSFDAKRGMLMLNTGVQIQSNTWEEVIARRFRWRELNAFLLFFDRSPLSEEKIETFFKFVRQVPRDTVKVCLLPSDVAEDDIRSFGFQSILREYIKKTMPDCTIVGYVDSPLGSIRDAIKTLRAKAEK
ncbi:MAG: hypothetical protein ACFFC7_12260 [Candidatus Hermodarchaeota archaeon]